MSYRKRVDARRTSLADVQFQNKFAQIAALVAPRNFYGVLGRGSAKTTDFLVERIIDVMYDMPGAPCCWLADTFANLTANIIPSLLEGLERKGFREGTHFVIEKEPPTFTEKEKADLPKWLRPHFWKPRNHLISYKRTIIFYTGMNIRFGSQDRPSTLAGSSYVHVFGDEAKYLKEATVANLLKAVRGYRLEYGNSVFFRGSSFTSDIADISHPGEDDWMLRQAQNMNIEKILLIMKAGLIMNETLHEYVAAKEEWLKSPSIERASIVQKKLHTHNLWRARWTELRRLDDASTFFLKASSYVNADILTEGWFSDAFAAGLNDTRSSILSLRPRLTGGNRFYAALSESHFYYDGIDESAYEAFSLTDQEDSRVLKYCNPRMPLRAGVDFGNMCSMSIAQRGDLNGRECLRVIRFLYTLAPEYINDLGRKFREYFAPMETKVLHLYYDRAGNTYNKVKKDQASDLKKAIEFDENGRRSGWNVIMLSMGQGNIPQPEEYHFMQELFAQTNPRLPIVLIDANAAKPLKLSLEGARTKVKNGVVYKDKSSEKLPIDQLPTRSTNPSDSFKYLMMSKEYRDIVKGRIPSVGLGGGPIVLRRK